MKQSIKNIIISATAAVLLITAYQAYWLTDIYVTLEQKQKNDINEAMRSADFEEINTRVTFLQEQEYGGTMAVSVGSESHHDEVGVKNEYQNQDEHSAEKESAGNTIPYDKFSNSLKDEEALRRVGLYMQKGIHDGLDAILPINPVCYDSLLSVKLDSLGINRKHTTLYLNETGSGTDTIQILGDTDIAEADTFQLTVNSSDDRQYLLLLERRFISVPRQMYSALLFSVFTLIVLILAFWHIINMIRRMRALEEMKSDFTNNITHELKTPIAVAYAANDALLNFGDNNNTEKTKKYLHICQEQLTLLTQLIEQILSLSVERRKTMKLNIEPVALASIIKKVAENHQLKTKKTLDIKCDVPSSLIVLADRIHLNNIINNLIDNAIKYSRDSVNINIIARQQNDGKVMVSIADNGIGIADAQQKFIFDKFYRVPHGNVHQVKGYGLGLFYVKTIMEKLGGTIHLKSEEGKGSTFTLTFNGEN